MLDIHRTDDSPNTKVYFSHSTLPTYLDPKNVSTKKQPFATIHKQSFSHSLNVILPEELWELLQLQLQKSPALSKPQYARVHMKLGEIIESEFLETYIKLGNIMMLSEGRPLVDNLFQLYEGKLRMELDKQTYERCGLQGTPVEDGGKKHQKQRWVVEYDLRATSMKHGKKGFGRLEWACKNVLNQSLTWLFHNLNAPFAESLAQGNEVLSRYAPWLNTIEPNGNILKGVLAPRLLTSNLTRLYNEEDAMALLEYIDMVELESPRIKEEDNIDPHLCRYEVPDFGSGTTLMNLVVAKWTGFIPPTFARDVFVALAAVFSKTKVVDGSTQDVTMTDPEQDEEEVARWFCMSAQAFGGKHTWSAMQFGNRDTFTWRVES